MLVVQASALDNTLANAVNLSKALADETRFRILLLLQEQELCACQIIEVFELANSTISRHLAVLKQAGLVQSRKSGRWMYYAWPQRPTEVQSTLLNALLASVQADPQIRADRERIHEILALDPEELCRIQSRRGSNT